MGELPLSTRQKALTFIRTLGPQEIVQDGLRRATQGDVTECSRSGATILGTVRNGNDPSCTARLEVTAPRAISPSCSCTEADLEPVSADGWCAHSIALLFRSFELGFFDTESGFGARDARFRPAVVSAQDVAAVIGELSEQRVTSDKEPSPPPNVEIFLELSSDRLGVQVRFDGQVREQSLFDSESQPSPRTLHNILLENLDQVGVWDETSACWYVNSSDGIERILGLLQEFPAVRSYATHDALSLSKELIEARLTIRWEKAGAELFMEWVTPDGKVRERQHELLGNGPYWTLIGNSLYRLSPHAARIASLFPLGPRFALSRSQVGPIVESLQSAGLRGNYIRIENEQLQPEAERTTPKVQLHLEGSESASTHFGTGGSLELTAVLEFEYPNTPPGGNTVYLPDREFEREAHERMLALGFDHQKERRRYFLSGTRALDVLSEGKELFPGWKVHGLDAVQRGIRFVESSIAVSLAESTRDEVKSRKGAAKGENRKIDWFDCHISLVLNNANVPLSTLFKSSAPEDTRWIRLDSGAYTRVPGGSLGQLKTMLGMIEPNFKLSNTIKTRLKTPLALGLSRLSDRNFQVSADRSLRSLAKQLEDFKGITQVPLSKKFDGTLRPYQREGVNWLSFLNDFELGGILADEMGLGKTVQTLAFLQTLKDKTKRASGAEKWKPALVIAPTSVMMNWWYEAKKFTPDLKTVVLHGTKRREIFPELGSYDIIITSYALLRIDRYELERFDFGILILDEAQHIKNFQAATTVAAKSLKARRRLALTGTPTENRPLELWSIMDFLMSGYLGTADFFKSNIERPILEQGSAAEVAGLLRAKTRPFILRRTKAEVERDLPPKVESTLHVEMTASQRELYAQILEEVRPRVMEAIEKKGVKGASVSILAALLRLRQVCNHPNSIDALKSLPGYDSGKFNLFKDIMGEALDAGRKILVFAQFREMLAIMRRHCEEAGISYEYLDGSTRDRQRVIDRFSFEESVRVFLISLKAGGQGLNLTAADTVIIYDPWWNPAVESQAVDRAHRIGQKKTVHVYRLVTEESVEQKIMDLKRRKAAIVEALVNERGLSPSALSKSDLEQLFMPLGQEG